jgi:hypothetical protein
MTPDAITITQLATVFGIAASIFAVLNVTLKWLVDYLQTKMGKNLNPIVATASRQTQSEQCRFDHSNVTNIVTAQNAHISKMLEQNARMIEAMKDASHVSELRHQIILTKLDRIVEKLPR